MKKQQLLDLIAQEHDLPAIRKTMSAEEYETWLVEKAEAIWNGDKK